MYHPTSATPSFSSCTAGQPCSVESSVSDGKCATEKFLIGTCQRWVTGKYLVGMYCTMHHSYATDSQCRRGTALPIRAEFRTPRLLGAKKSPLKVTRPWAARILGIVALARSCALNWPILHLSIIQTDTTLVCERHQEPLSPRNKHLLLTA